MTIAPSALYGFSCGVSFMLAAELFKLSDYVWAVICTLLCAYWGYRATEGGSS